MNLGKHYEQIAQEYLKSHGYNLLMINEKLFNVEVDIVAEKNSEHHIFEVKGCSAWEWEYLETRIMPRQKKRLLKVLSGLQQSGKKSWRCHLILVEKEGRIEVFKDFLAEGLF